CSLQAEDGIRDRTVTGVQTCALPILTILSLAEVLEGEPLAFAADMHCGTHWSALDQQWQGVSAADLVQLAPPAPDARSALVFAEYGYATNVHLDDLVSPRSVLATHWNGAPL